MDKAQPSTRWRDKILNTVSLMDWSIMGVVGLLCLISLIMVTSSTQYVTEASHVPNPFSYLLRQSMGMGIGLVACLGALLIPYRHYESKVIIYSFSALIAITIVLTRFWGVEINGARSWLRLPFIQIQPSELAKISAILLTGLICVTQQREVILSQERFFYRWRVDMVWPSFLILLQITLIFLQPDLGMVMIILATVFLILMTYSWNRMYNYMALGTISVLFLAVQIIGRVFSDSLVASSSYQMKRIGSFADPFKYAQGAGYQLIRAYIAISRGGLFGRGIGQSLTKQEGMPAGHTDYILAIIGEETGLVGLTVVIILLMSLVFLCFRWAAKSQSLFRKAVFTGVGSLLLIQSTLNIGGVSGLIPLTGVTLPFISYGGTSMVLTMLLVGLLQVFIVEENRVAKEQATAPKEDDNGI